MIFKLQKSYVTDSSSLQIRCLEDECLYFRFGGVSFVIWQKSVMEEEVDGSLVNKHRNKDDTFIVQLSHRFKHPNGAL